jgi:hypothetical protein
MNMKRKAVLIAFISVLMVSCSPTYYIPNTQNVPLIESKGQINLSIAGNDNQVELQGAYGITHNLAVQLTGDLVIPEDLDNGNGGSGKYLEGGVGYYKALGKRFLFEGYALIGFGGLENHLITTVSEYPGTSGKISANLLRIGFQPELSFKHKYFSITGSFRLANLNYSNIVGSLEYNETNQIKYLKTNRSTFIFEPALTLRAGLEKIKLQVQLAKSWNLSNKDFRQEVDLLTIGLNLDF